MQGASLHRSYRFRGLKIILPPPSGTKSAFEPSPPISPFHNLFRTFVKGIGRLDPQPQASVSIRAIRGQTLWRNQHWQPGIRTYQSRTSPGFSRNPDALPHRPASPSPCLEGQRPSVS